MDALHRKTMQKQPGRHCFHSIRSSSSAVSGKRQGTCQLFRRNVPWPYIFSLCMWSFTPPHSAPHVPRRGSMLIWLALIAFFFCDVRSQCSGSRPIGCKDNNHLTIESDTSGLETCRRCGYAYFTQGGDTTSSGAVRCCSRNSLNTCLESPGLSLRCLSG